MNLYELHRGDAPLVIDVPHAGTFLPLDLWDRLTPAARNVPDTDWHVEKLYAFARTMDVTLMIAAHSRIAVDLNRDPTGAALYPGADNTEMCPTRTFADEAIYVEGGAPLDAEIVARRGHYFDPYHEALAAELQRVRTRHGYAVLLDGHSIRAEVPRFFAGHLPDLNLGTADGTSCAPALQAAASGVLASAAGFTHIVNGRFKGGYVTRRHGQPAQGIHALQLEMAECCYMDEAPPYRWDDALAAPLIGVLTRLAGALVAWRPELSA